MFEPLHPELQRYYMEDPFPMVKHPLCFSVPHADIFNQHVNKRYTFVKERVVEEERRENWAGVLMFYEKPFRLDRLIELYQKHQFSQHTLSSLAHDIWVSVENIYEQRREWILTLSECIPSSFMSVEDEDYFNRLPQRIMIHRGGDREGLSWTLDRERAKWFARRWDKNAGVHTVTIDKSEVFAYTDARNEQEIIYLGAHK